MIQYAYSIHSATDQNRFRLFLLENLFCLVLLLEMTGLFSFAAPLFGVRIAVVSFVLFILNCFYIAGHPASSRQLFCKKYLFYWFIFLVIWPLLATLYASKVNMREIGLHVYYFTLFLAATVFILRNGFGRFHHILTFAVVITVIGLIWSLFSNTFFQSVAGIAEHDLRYEGRAYGFFMQPNMAAINLTLLFVIWFMGLPQKRLFPLIIITLGFLLIISLTGSRGGFLTAAAAVILIWTNKIVRIRNSFTIAISSKTTVSFLLIVICFLFLMPLLLTFLSNVLPEHSRRFDILARIKAISRMKLTEADSTGKSTLVRRFDVYKDYIAMTGEHPVLGNGFGAINILTENGTLRHSSHNQYLKIAYETGVFHLIFYLLLLISIYLDPRRKKIEKRLGTNTYVQFLAVIALAGMFSSMVLDTRFFYCILGCLFVMLAFPHTVPVRIMHDK